MSEKLGDYAGDEAIRGAELTDGQLDRISRGCEHCKNCKYWIPRNFPEWDKNEKRTAFSKAPELYVYWKGTCQRFPPNLISESPEKKERTPLLWAWPQTNWDDWCGEWKQSNL